MASNLGPGVSQLYNKKGWQLKFQHVATGGQVVFPAFITQFSEAYSPEYNEEMVFGRMDPIAIYKATKRTISLGWELPSYSFEGAKENLAKTDTLIRFLYPVYGSNPRASTEKVTAKDTKVKGKKKPNGVKRKLIEANKKTTTKRTRVTPTAVGRLSQRKTIDYGAFERQSTNLIASPLMKITFTNLIAGKVMKNPKSPPGPGGVKGTKKKPKAYTHVITETGERTKSTFTNEQIFRAPLVGIITGFNFEPDFQNSDFYDPGFGTLYPKVIKLSCNITVLHDHRLGFDERGKPVFPLGWPHR